MPGFRLMAILGAALFSGAAIYISLVEHPARMECGTRLAATVFGPSYRRAALMQVILALMASVGGAGAWLTGAPWKWLLGALFILAVIPYTLLVIGPTNRNSLIPKLRGLRKRRTVCCRNGEGYMRCEAFLGCLPLSRSSAQ